MVQVLFGVVFLTVSMSGARTSDIEVIKNIDLDRYAGTWYEIARLPNKHEKEMVEVTMVMKRGRNGRFEMITTGYKGSRGGKRSTVKGDVEIQDPHNTGDLKVKVFLFSVDYKIIDIDKFGYQYALVTSEGGKYLWIFSRSPVMDPHDYNKMIVSAQEKGFDVAQLERVSQVSNSALVGR
jgi:lipocalin